jgi:peptidoglycan/LPS O-acetylase OafA/YrhL
MNQRFFGIHPGVVGLMLAIGATMFLYFGYALLNPESAASAANSDHDLRLALRWTMTVLGGLMYLAGGVLFGKSRDINGFLAFLLHLLPLLGLIIMTIIGRNLTPHERWERDNPGFDKKTMNRTYRKMKSLY